MNILILTGKFGMGHYSAANSLKEEIVKKYPDHKVVVEDIIEYAVPQHADMIYKSFGFMAKKGSRLYNSFYKFSADKGCTEPPLLYQFFIRRLNRLLVEQKPDVIISTLPLCSQVLAKQKRRNEAPWELVTCITDITSHGEWINEEVDFYLVAAESVRQELIRKGVSPAKVLICGIPVRGDFYQERESKRERKEKKQVLVMGGGLGLLPESEAFYDGLNEIGQAEFTVITGTNEKLLNFLEGKYENIKAIGYTNQVADYMKQADALLTKPGGITVFEAIAAETRCCCSRLFFNRKKTTEISWSAAALGAF